MQELVDAGRRWYGGHLWIGLYDDIHSWRWSVDEEGYYDTGGAEFRMWGASEPSNGNEKCALMFLAGTWHDISCQTKAPFVCYNAGASPRFIVVSEVRTWPEAQSYCREHYTDLASVRNNSDNNQIKDLLSAEYTWIGLYRDSWKWSDRSPVSFTNWRNGKPGGLPCVLTHKGQWEDRRCDIKLFFVCQTVSVKQRVMRMKLTGKDSTLNLDDATDAILQQLSRLLDNSGLSENMRLSWRKRPDGKTLYLQAKDKDEEQKDTTCHVK
ncbi:C-type mannose receptor 2-like [Sphaeramia orbicularis]|uniref:C-type mannose receptor 2-like n=1 Tax=Sphaeramia orbicularis TaxID=375764 RepID=UPI00117CBE33|nr:C-type mannose receptor 2-like [Sphaeramia orbicularis]